MTGGRAIWLAWVIAALGCAGAAARSAIQRVYVGGYGSEIAIVDFDAQTGALTKRARVAAGSAPSYMAFTRDARFAFAIDEVKGRVIAYAIRRDGGLQALNSAASGGGGPAHLAVHPSGRWIVVAHYGGGEITIVPVGADGRVGAPRVATNADCKHAHQAVFDRQGAYLFVPCLGNDHVLSFHFELERGVLRANDPPRVAVEGGPRHLALDPERRRAYVLSEHASVITAFDYDPATGTLRTPAMVPSYRRVKGKSAHVALHPGGRWLYASNREENSLGVFALEGDRAPRAVSFVTEGIATPRDFAIDPTGRWLIVANQSGRQDVVVFAIDPASGALTRRAAEAIGGEPAFVQAIALPR